MERILKLLDQNARFTNKEIAVMLGKTEEEVAAAVADFEKRGIIKGYKAVIDWEKSEREYVSALIEIKVIPQRDRGFEEIAARIVSFPEVESMYLMSGAFDFALTITGKTFQEVAMFVARKLAPIESVQSTATHFILKRYKDDGVTFSQEIEDERGNASL